MMNKVTVHIAVLDYCSCSIKMYDVTLSSGWQTEDVEQWLLDNTEYKKDQCYYMCSEEEIKIEYA